MSKDQDSFFDRLSRFSTHLALIEGDQRISYGHLADQADAFSRQLPSHRLLVFLEARNTIEAITAYIGCLRSGHVVHLFGEGDETHLEGLKEVYQPNIVVRHGKSSDREARQTIERRHEEPIALHDDLAVLLSTSGSTGSPKFVKLSKANINSNAFAIADYLGLDHTERAITALKANYSYGMSVVNSHLACGAALILTDSSVTAPDFWTMFSEHKATSFAGVPHTFDILQRAGEWAELPHLRYVTQAGGKLEPDTVRHMGELAHQHGWRFFVMYGQTEASPRMAYLPPEHTKDHPDCIGRAIPGGELSIIDSSGAPVTETDIPGELVYAGPNVMMGYAADIHALSTDETPTHLKTGDIAVRCANGLFRIVGRSSRFIKPFGVRVNLDELQIQLRQRAAGAVCTGTDAQLIVAVPKNGGADTEVLSGWIAETYKIPAFMTQVMTVDTIPLLANGKVDYQAIGRLAVPPDAQIGGALEATGKDGWESVSAIFQALTGAQKVTGTSTFLTLAADSLSYVVTSLAIEDYLGFVPADWETMSVAALEKLRHSGEEVSSAQSLHYLNASRILLLLLGVPYHAAMVFSSTRDWIMSAPVRSSIAAGLSAASHSFRMFAFFFISGYFAMLILKRSPVSQWLGKQTVRLGMPLVFGSLLLAPLENAALAIAPGRVGLPPFAYWLDAMTKPGTQWLTHRWFLLTLLVLGCILVAFTALRRQSGSRTPSQFFLNFVEQHPRLFWGLLLLGMAPYGLASASISRMTGGRGLLLFGSFEWRTILSFAPPFFLGVIMLLRPKILAWFLRPSVFTVGLGVALCVVFIWLDGTRSLFGKIIENANWIACGLIGTRLFFSVMHRWMNRPHLWIARLLDASYIIYLWHMVFVLLLSGLCIRLHINPLLSVALTSIASLACSWTVYLGVCRSRILSLIFNGGPLRGGAMSRL